MVGRLMQKLLFELYEDDLDGLKSPNTAYTIIDTDDYKAEQDLAEKYRAFVSEIMRLSLASIGVFSFLLLNIRPPMMMPFWGLVIAYIGIIFLATSIFFAMRFQFGSSEGLRWYIAGFRYRKPAENPSNDNDQITPDRRAAIIQTLDRRAAIIQKCRYDKFWAALCLIIGATFMAFATISAFLSSSDR
jgi:hypothetical protein